MMLACGTDCFLLLGTTVCCVSWSWWGVVASCVFLSHTTVLCLFVPTARQRSLYRRSSARGCWLRRVLAGLRCPSWLLGGVTACLRQRITMPHPPPPVCRHLYLCCCCCGMAWRRDSCKGEGGGVAGPFAQGVCWPYCLSTDFAQDMPPRLVVKRGKITPACACRFLHAVYLANVQW